VLLANEISSPPATCQHEPSFRGLARSVSEAVISVRAGRREAGLRRGSFRTMSGRDVTLRIYVEAGKEARCVYAMDSLKRAMRWDETHSGANTISIFS
jgi:hypothetical protein